MMVLALLAERRGALDEALKTYEDVLALRPHFAPAMRQMAVIYSHSHKDGDLDQAYNLAQQARGTMPDDLELAKTLGILAFRRSDYNRSMLLLRETSEKSRTDGEVFYYLGMDYDKLKNTNECRLALQEALDLRIPDILAAPARRILNGLK